MKLKRLLEIVEGKDPESLVVVSSDPEGNRFREAGGVTTKMVYDPTHEEIGISELTEEAIEAEYTQDDVMPDGKPAVIIWPHD